MRVLLLVLQHGVINILDEKRKQKALAQSFEQSLPRKMRKMVTFIITRQFSCQKIYLV
jgi:hypothetical protein